MKKTIKLIPAALSAILALTLTACGAGRSTSDTDNTAVSATSGTESFANTAAESVQNTNTAITSNEYISAYKNYLKDYIKENSSSALNASFSLHYLDDDNTPELFISTSGGHLGRIIVLTYNKNQVIELGTFGRDGIIGFGEKQGVIIETNTAKKQTTARVYKLKNGKFKETWTGTHLFGGYPSPDTEEGYHVNGKEVKKSMFEKEVKKNLPETILTNAKSFDAEMFPEINFVVDGEEQKLTNENIENFIR